MLSLGPWPLPSHGSPQRPLPIPLVPSPVVVGAVAAARKGLEYSVGAQGRESREVVASGTVEGRQDVVLPPEDEDGAVDLGDDLRRGRAGVVACRG